MASVNATRSAIELDMERAVRDARMVGTNDSGLIAVWSGGYTINIYDAARDWQEVNAFTSGGLAGLTDYESEEAYEMAADRMRSEGFKPIR